jgi:pyruvate-formate lyase-activating enzyme
VPGETVTPAEIVRAAKQTECLSISYTFTEPTIFYELAYDTAVLAKEQGLKNNFVSNGFIGEAPLREIAPLLDAVNIDLKFFREASYRRISRARARNGAAAHPAHVEPMACKLRHYELVASDQLLHFPPIAVRALNQLSRGAFTQRMNRGDGQ